MDTPEPETVKLVDEVKTAFAANDADRVRAILNRHPPLKALINQPVGPFDSPAIVNVRSREMLDVLLDAGADINARSRWWAGGFGLLDSAEPELAAYAIERGAIVDAHAAARLGMLDRLRELVSRDPSVIKRRRCIRSRFTATPKWRRLFSVSIRHSRQPTLISTARHSDGQSMDSSTGGTAGRATTAPPSQH